MNEIFHHLIRNYTRCFMPIGIIMIVSLYLQLLATWMQWRIFYTILCDFSFISCLLACLFVSYAVLVMFMYILFFFLCIYFVNLFYCHLVLLPPSVLFVMCRVKTHVHYSHAAYISIHTDAVDAVVASLFNYIWLLTGINIFLHKSMHVWKVMC